MGLFLSIRLGYLFLTVFALLWAPPAGDAVPQSRAWGGISDLVFGAFEQWDARWMLEIVADGYTTQSAAFMPGYPALVWLVGHLFGSSLVGAVLVSVVAAALGVHFVAAIASELLGRSIERDTVLLLSIYPVAYVFTAAYTEGLFLAAAAGAVYYAMRDRYWLAGLLAAAATGTRVFGLALIPTLLILTFPIARRRGFAPLVPVIALPLAALAAVSVYFERSLGDALAFSHAQSFWDRRLSPAGPLGGAWESLRAAADGVATIATLPPHSGGPSGLSPDVRLAAWDIVDFGILVGAVALTVVVFRRLGPALGLYSTGILVIAVASPVSDHQEVLQSMGRFVLIDFPLFIAAASLLSLYPRTRSAALASLATLAAVACVAFSRGIWIA